MNLANSKNFDKQSDEVYRDEILSITAEDIQNYAPMMDAIMKQNNLCVSGNENIINSNKALFQSIKNLCDN